MYLRMRQNSFFPPSSVFRSVAVQLNSVQLRGLTWLYKANSHDPKPVNLSWCAHRPSKHFQLWVGATFCFWMCCLTPNKHETGFISWWALFCCGESRHSNWFLQVTFKITTCSSKECAICYICTIKRTKIAASCKCSLHISSFLIIIWGFVCWYSHVIAEFKVFYGFYVWDKTWLIEQKGKIFMEMMH